jgi:alkylhydroperoxidase family enzyme
LARRLTGKDPLPARLLAWFPKGALGAGLFEATAAGGGDLDARSGHGDGDRVLAIARIVASATSGCPFCLDMNAATWARTGLPPAGLQGLVAFDEDVVGALDPRARAAARYARALSLTPVVVPPALVAELLAAFSPGEVVVLATTIAQVGYWSRFNQGLGVPAAGFFDTSVCALPGLPPG